MSELSDSLQGLFDFLEGRGLSPPSRNVRIAEIGRGAAFDEQGRLRVRRHELREASEYKGRFQELTGMNLPWINMNCYGVFNDLLIIVIETSTTSAESLSRTSINYSGPAIEILQHDWRVGELLTIE